MVKPANDHVFRDLPTHADFQLYRAAFMWYDRQNPSSREPKHLEHRLVSWSYKGRSMPIAFANLTFTCQQLTSVFNTVERCRQQHHCAPEQAWDILRLERCQIPVPERPDSPSSPPLSPLPQQQQQQQQQQERSPSPTPLHSTVSRDSSSRQSRKGKKGRKKRRAGTWQRSTPARQCEHLVDDSTVFADAEPETRQPLLSRRSPSIAASASTSATAPAPASFFPVALPSFTADLLQSPTHAQLLSTAMPSVEWRVRRTRADGLCWLHAIAAIADPTAAESTERIDSVRRELQEELERWGEQRWLLEVPWYGVRDWLWSECSNRQDISEEGSYGMCQRLLQQDRWFNHAVFYLASSLYHIDFFLVAVIGPLTQSLVYRRRVLTAPIPRIKAAVWHSSSHYEPLVLSADSAATAFAAIYALPQLEPPSSGNIDRDRLRLEQLSNPELLQHAVSLLDSEDGYGDRAIKPSVTVTVQSLQPTTVTAAAAAAVLRPGRQKKVKQQVEQPAIQQLQSEPLPQQQQQQQQQQLQRTTRAGRSVKVPARLIEQTTLPRAWRRPPAPPKWALDIGNAHAMCVECFRVFVVEQCEVDFTSLSPTDPLTTGKLLPALTSNWKNSQGNDVHFALCRNDYCAPARQKLLQSVSSGLSPTVLSPDSECDQVSGWLHTGMHVPDGSEAAMWAIEQKRYPHLVVNVSRIPSSGRGVFVAAGRTLHENEVVCSMLGQIRAMLQNSPEAHHPLAFDFGLDCVSNNLDHVYGLRLFCHTFAATINSTHNTNLTPNCVFAPHPHFLQYTDQYVRQEVYPSGAYCVMVRPGFTIEAGQELLVKYRWGQVLHTETLL